MNEVHLRGVVKTEPWRYDGNLYVRVSVRRDSQRPGRSASEGGDFDYVTVLFPGGAQRGQINDATGSVPVWQALRRWSGGRWTN